MASISSETLFKSHRQNVLNVQSSFCRSGSTSPSDVGEPGPTNIIHPGPTTTHGCLRNGFHTIGGTVLPSLSTAHPSFYTNGSGGSDTNTALPDRHGEFMHCNVVKENDARRGFRLFDGVLLSVKDVSSEELFIERMKIAYSAYEAYVAELVDKSPLEIAKGMVQAVSACLVKYFTTQSMLRTNRPFIAKTLNLDCQDMLCTHSDFMQSFLFTNASPDDEVIISLAEKVYNERNLDVCEEDPTIRPSADAFQTSDDVTDQLFDFVMRLAERNVIGGTNASYNSSRDKNNTEFNTLSDELPFQPRKDGAGRSVDGGTTAMLIVVTDLEALHNYIAYVLYLTPAQLSRRYNVDFDSLRRPTTSSNNNNTSMINVDCFRAREARKRKRQDNTKTAIRAVIEKKKREKIDTMVERSAACETTLQQSIAQTVRRNNDLLCHVLLMLFDKCLSSIIDKGFENLNTRRGYAVSSAKEIGAATIYTGIIDTVGEVSTRVDGHAFSNIIKDDGAVNSEMENKMHQTQLRFSFPLSSVVTEVTKGDSNVKPNNDSVVGSGSNSVANDSDEEV